MFKDFLRELFHLYEIRRNRRLNAERDARMINYLLARVDGNAPRQQTPCGH